MEEAVIYVCKKCTLIMSNDNRIKENELHLPRAPSRRPKKVLCKPSSDVRIDMKVVSIAFLDHHFKLICVTAVIWKKFSLVQSS